MSKKVSIKRWRSVKAKTPIIGLDDGGFDRFQKVNQQVPVFGVIMKGAAYVDGVIQCLIDRDDKFATLKLSEMILSSIHRPQLQGIFLQGITTGGFGVIDIHELFRLTEIPVIVVLRKIPNFQKIKRSLLELFSDGQDRWQCMENAGKPILVQKSPQILLQVAGIHPDDAFSLTKKCTMVGTIPEALRIAHFIGASNYRSLK
ncbi:endonuclease dU [Candidatus Hodarchaeum mangrovi]